MSLVEQDLTEHLAPRLLDLTLTESRSDEAEQVVLRLHDHDGLVALPRVIVTVQGAGGRRDSGLIDKSTFVVDDVEHSGLRTSLRSAPAQPTSPDRCAAAASGADMTPCWATS